MKKLLISSIIILTSLLKKIASISSDPEKNNHLLHDNGKTMQAPFVYIEMMKFWCRFE